ncbi:6-bladed beta-propeller [Maribellus maritimus]|uniref:6-bladed beta-propeller n=1 Tax=Maribellus maritimus TaxID=2870838 RepID=UPI001EEA8304|nr:6-bladed beta-propeller [Maribellus maritimus]MCG6188043.1 6-bladed beta-propeller [Maribellus maritimus]
MEHQSKNLSSYLSILVFVFLCSCNSSEQNNVVSLEPTHKEKLNLGKPIQIIKLETSAESQLGFIMKTAIDGVNNRIFVLADFNIFIFDTNGKFISKLKKGRGPGEISMIISFSLNKQNQSVYVLDNSDRICVFDYNGDIKSDYRLGEFYGKNIQVIDDDNVFLVSISVYDKEPYFVGIYNFEKKEITQRFIHRDDSPYPKIAKIINNAFTITEGKYFFSTTNIFALYEFKDSVFYKVISYDLGNRKIPESIIQNTTEKGKSYFDKEILNDNLVPYLINSFCYKNFYLAIIEDSKRSCYVISKKDKGKVFQNGPITSYFNLPDIRSFSLPVEISEDYLVFAASPTDFFDENSTADQTNIQLGNQKLEIGLEENPFLVVVK